MAWLIRVAMVIGTIGLADSARAAADQLLAAASNQHLWVVLEPGGEAVTFQLAHHPLNESNAHYRTLHVLSQSPAAIAARDNNVWLVMPPRLISGRWQREVFTASVHRNGATGLHYTSPAGRLEMLPPLAGLGRLAGLVATTDGPVALLLPSPRSGPVANLPTTQSALSVLDKPALMRLGHGQSAWSEIPLPDGFVGSRSTLMAAALDDLALLDSIPDNPGRCMFAVRSHDGGWSAHAMAMDIRAVKALAAVAGQFLVVREERSGEDLDLAYIRPGGLLALASFAGPADKWAACGLSDQILLIERTDAEDEPVIVVRSVDPLAGVVRSEASLTRQPLTASRLWQTALGLGLFLSAVMAIVLLRPSRIAAITVDAGRTLPPGRRLAALAIDLIVAIPPTLLLLDCRLADFLSLPLTTLDYARCWPNIALIGIATGLMTLSELLFGRSLGKMAVGGRIAALDGTPPKSSSLLVRSVVRLIVMLVPPLAVFAFSNSHMQGLADIAGHTVVVADDDPDAALPDAE